MPARAETLVRAEREQMPRPRTHALPAPGRVVGNAEKMYVHAVTRTQAPRTLSWPALEPLTSATPEAPCPAANWSESPREGADAQRACASTGEQEHGLEKHDAAVEADAGESTEDE